MAMIPVRYVGPKAFEVEHNYGSWVEFCQGEVTQVPDYAAKILLEKHPSEYKDARTSKQQHQEIQPVEAPPVKKDDEVELPPLVSLENLTREQLSAFAHKHWGVDLPPNGKKPEMIAKARALMGGAPRNNY